jgi:hypothetical protein
MLKAIKALFAKKKPEPAKNVVKPVGPKPGPAPKVASKPTKGSTVKATPKKK